MYCPKCRSEFREGIFECSDCLVPLVVNLPPEGPKPIPEYVDFKEIKTSLDMGDIAIMKSILDDNQIIYFIHNEYLGSTFGAAFPARIMISKDQAQEAKDLLKNFL